MAKGEKHDHKASALLKAWDMTLRHDERPGSLVRYKGAWVTLIQVHGEHAVISGEGSPDRVVPASSCRRAWDPHVDPPAFAKRLAKEKSKRK